MIKRVNQKLISLIVLAIFIGRMFAPVAVLAQSAPPPPPTAPTAPPPPEAPPAAPTAPPSGTYTYPTSPPAPTSPPPPPAAPTAPPPGGYVYPTQAPAPTGNTLPTGSALPEGETLPTGSVAPTGSELNSLNGGSSGGSENPGGAYSAGNTQSGSVNDPYNYMTGAGSYNYGQEIIDQSMAELNKNLAEMENKINAMTASGFNYANLNTLSGEVFSGDVNSSVNLINKLNSNLSGLGSFASLDIYGSYMGDIELQFTEGSPLSAFSQASETVSKNAVTGPASENYAISDGNFTVKEANGNDATLTNDINLGADSGNNTASFNTGNGIVDTGDANALANIMNMVNTNINAVQWMIGVINIYGQLLGNIILPKDDASGTNGVAGTVNTVGNSNTGPGSTNYASSTSNSTSEFTNVNNADIVSSINTDANTGNNTASVNTGGGYVATGNANASVANSTVANSNTVDEEGTVWLVIVNEMGKWVGYIVGEDPTATTASNSLPIATQTAGFGQSSFSVDSTNSLTGPGSTNVTEINQNDSTSVVNSNDAKITNNITANANTGNNESTYNTGAGVIQTGDATTGVSLLNLANVNVTAKKFVVLFVNVIGDFMGNIVPTEESYEVNSPLPTTAPLPTVPPLPTLPAANVTPPVGGIVNSGNQEDYYGQSGQYEDSYYYYYYYPEYEDNSYGYYPQQYTTSVNRTRAKSARVTALQNQYQNYESPIVEGKTKAVKRGTSVSASFVKATQSSGPGILVGGISLKVTNSWLLFVPLALFIYIWRRKNRIKVDFAKYVNMILEIIL